MTAKGNFRFKVGDWIAHYTYGLGKVINIDHKDIQDTNALYYQVKTKDFTYWIPLENQYADHIKPIRSKKEFEDALKLMAKEPEGTLGDIKSRKGILQQRWLKGDLSSRAELLRDLYVRKSLSYQEKEMVENIKLTFINEWVVSDETMTEAKARSSITVALEQSLQKLEINNPSVIES